MRAANFCNDADTKIMCLTYNFQKFYNKKIRISKKHKDMVTASIWSVLGTVMRGVSYAVEDQIREEWYNAQP